LAKPLLRELIMDTIPPDDFSPLAETEHMFQWLAEEPYEAIRSEVDAILKEQVPGSQLASFRALSEPQWLTGARTSEEDPEHGILVRTGVAFQFALHVQNENGDVSEFGGVFSWVGVCLDDPPNAKQRVWFDVNGTLEEFGSDGELRERVYFE
jgi:hypothetical protein